MKRTITMTETELERSKIIQMAEEKRLSQGEGAERLGDQPATFPAVITKISQTRGSRNNLRTSNESQQ